MPTKLSLDIQDTSNPKTFRVVDHSEYNDRINIKEAYLSIIPPGFDQMKSFKVKPGFSEVFNASILGILPAKTFKQLTDLPDGLYQISFSVPPTDKLLVEYSYFRINKLLQKYFNHLCKVYENKRNFPIAEFAEKKQELIWIKILIDSSKYAAEDLHDTHLAIQFYNEASELLGNSRGCLI